MRNKTYPLHRIIGPLSRTPQASKRLRNHINPRKTIHQTHRRSRHEHYAANRIQRRRRSPARPKPPHPNPHLPVRREQPPWETTQLDEYREQERERADGRTGPAPQPALERAGEVRRPSGQVQAAVEEAEQHDHPGGAADEALA